MSRNLCISHVYFFLFLPVPWFLHKSKMSNSYVCGFYLLFVILLLLPVVYYPLIVRNFHLYNLSFIVFVCNLIHGPQLIQIFYAIIPKRSL
jgi:hypothetical protein